MPHDLTLDCELASRFVYWTGASGRRYIHTVYEAGACPPLPGAIYVSVIRNPGGERLPLTVGRFPKSFALNLASPNGTEAGNAAEREIHVHLLAESDTDGDRIVADLHRGLKLHSMPAAVSAEAARPQLSLFAA